MYVVIKENLFLLDDYCVENPRMKATCMLELFKLAQQYTELATYFVLFGSSFRAITDIKRLYLQWITKDEQNYYSKRNHKCIMLDSYLADLYTSTEFNYLDPISDYNQMWNIGHSIKSFPKTYVQIMNDEINKNAWVKKNSDPITDYRQSALIYDSWACTALDITDRSVRSEIMNNVDDFVNIIIEAMLDTNQDQSNFYSLIVNNNVTPVKDDVDLVIDQIVDKCVDKVEEFLVDVLNKYEIFVLRTCVSYTIGYIWMYAFRRAIDRISTPFDRNDYLEFIHTMYEITRHNYVNMEV